MNIILIWREGASAPKAPPLDPPLCNTYVWKLLTKILIQSMCRDEHYWGSGGAGAAGDEKGGISDGD